MRALYVAAVDARHPLTDEQLAASLAETLKQKPHGSDWWVFAYGSLLWNPLFPFEDAQPATLSGRHRRFCLWSLASRGTATQPGLVLRAGKRARERGRRVRIVGGLSRARAHCARHARHNRSVSREARRDGGATAAIALRFAPRVHFRAAARPQISLRSLIQCSGNTEADVAVAEISFMTNTVE